MKTIPLCGQILSDNQVYHDASPILNFNGLHNDTRASFSLGEDVLSKHLLMIGSTGCGKTNTFYHIISQLKSKMTKDCKKEQ